ncbi:MAG: PocR ligand-binding domain-containing protein, partial [Treponema sp.]|nr:PocR ligand-binding domain-containing protein [Treponema sp.]
APGLPLCGYCELVREKLLYEHRCIRMDREMCLRSTNSPTPLVYRCHAGLVDSAFPIKLNEEVAGYAMLGQFRIQNTIPAAILQDWEKNEFDQAALKTAFAERPFFEKTSMENMLNLFSMLCDYIAAKGYVRIRQLDISSEVLRWVESHISDPISFKDAAAHIGYSQSTILKILKKKLGMNFKQLCILKKIEQFELIVTKDPLISIADASFKVGYRDVSYFSRLYKNVRSIAPSVFIKSIYRGSRK